MGADCVCENKRQINRDPDIDLVRNMRHKRTISIKRDCQQTKQNGECQTMQIIKDERIMNQPIYKRISTDDRELVADNDRIGMITTSSNMFDLEAKIWTCYNSEDEEYPSDDSEIYMETVRRRSIERAIKPEMDDELTNAEMNDMQYEVQRQLLHLTKRATPGELNELYRNRQLSKVYIDTPISCSDDTIINYGEDSSPDFVSHSNLYRMSSGHKWSEILIDLQKEEMSKQMLHLASQTISSE